MCPHRDESRQNRCDQRPSRLVWPLVLSLAFIINSCAGKNENVDIAFGQKRKDNIKHISSVNSTNSAIPFPVYSHNVKLTERMRNFDLIVCERMSSGQKLNYAINGVSVGGSLDRIKEALIEKYSSTKNVKVILWFPNQPFDEAERLVTPLSNSIVVELHQSNRSVTYDETAIVIWISNDAYRRTLDDVEFYSAGLRVGLGEGGLNAALKLASEKMASRTILVLGVCDMPTGGGWVENVPQSIVQKKLNEIAALKQYEIINTIHELYDHSRDK